MKRDWVQLTTNLGVIVGLAILIYEVNQANLYAKAENVSANISFWSDRQLSVIGENSSEALAKAMTNPESLTPQELVVVNAYHQHLLVEMYHAAYQTELGIFITDWSDYRDYIREHLDYPFGRKWWARQREHMKADSKARLIAGVIDEFLSDEENSRPDFFDSLKGVE